LNACGDGFGSVTAVLCIGEEPEIGSCPSFRT
jgi:hypothetical protein